MSDKDTKKELTSGEREELIVLFQNAEKNIFELKKQSFYFLSALTAVTAFLMTHKIQFFTNKLCLFYVVTAVLFMCTIVSYSFIYGSMDKHRKRIGNIKNKFSDEFIECYAGGPKTGNTRWQKIFSFAYMFILYAILWIEYSGATCLN